MTAARQIFLTTRSDPAPNGVETRDGVDQAMVSFLADLGYAVWLVPNHPANLKKLLASVRPHGVVLSGGNDVDPARYRNKRSGRNVSRDRDETELELVRFCRQERIPLVGVCRGLQVLNIACGGSLSHDLGAHDGRDSHVAVRHEVRLSEAFPVEQFRGKHLEVNSYHDHGVAKDDLAPDLVPLAESPDGLVEALRHPSLPLYAIQWHPERRGSPGELDLAFFRHVFGNATTR